MQDGGEGNEKTYTIVALKISGKHIQGHTLISVAAR